ncbi:MAG: anthranilate phosphoribosyltransferase [Methanothermobacter tenebrarum]|nr:anthranilate phosphoribosyltransferase [Methanothermobacter sp.]HOQ20306.1 anthranilate phosphoribosyltransferase [Methanothermobacter sp.]
MIEVEFNNIIQKITTSTNLREKEAYNCMMDMIHGKLNDIQTAAILSSLATKGEAVPEITGFAKAMRDSCKTIKTPPGVDVVDSCGTGGDRLKTFNISTAAAIIAASAGVPIAKHGNRAVTGSCGGADILEAAGVKIDIPIQKVELSLEKIGITFMFAPKFHTATRNVMHIRQTLGIRTIFNILGPLTSPAKAKIQLLGVFDPSYVKPLAEVLSRLGVKKAMVVHGFDEKGEPAIDEISIMGKTHTAILDNGKIHTKRLYPEDFGLENGESESIKAAPTVHENLKIFLSVLKGEKDSKAAETRLNITLANAAALLYLGGKAKNLEDAVEISRERVESGDALKKLKEFIKFTRDGPAGI